MRRFPPLIAAIALLLVAPGLGAELTSPQNHFGFRIGEDRRLAPAEGIERYFELVASESDRVRTIDLGPTTEGRRTIAAIISAPENIARLEEIRQINQRLSDPRTLSPDQARTLAAQQKVVLAIGAGIHASEIGATLAANELLYTLASATDASTLQVLQNVVLILVPMLNPDGHRLVTDWYARNLGTSHEGGLMPWLYHKYAGHDINRDAFMMNLAENRNLARLLYTTWHPQVFLTMHQMEQNGPRFFVPPNTDPIDPNYDPLIWRSSALLGDAMALQLQHDGHKGVVSGAKYDYYWPGFEDSAPLGHNIVCLLTEVASVNVASPVTIAPSDLRGGFKGLNDYRPQINFPEPWPGGRWALRDIVDYDLSAVQGLLFAVSAYREQLLQNYYEMGRHAVEAGVQGGPYAFVIPSEQHDPYTTARLENVLIQGGIEIHRALESFRADGTSYPPGTDVIFLSQPYRAYVKTLLERQNFPGRPASNDAPSDRPYDVAGWTLPSQMGVDVLTIEHSFEAPPTSRLTSATTTAAAVWGERKPAYWLVEARGNAAALAVNRLVAAGASPSWTSAPLESLGFRYDAGSLVVPYVKTAETAVTGIARELGLRVEGAKGKLPTGTRPIGGVRVALYRPWTENIDEGWTRWLLERYEFPFTTLVDAEVRAGNLRSKYDAIILPSAAPDRLITGYSTDSVPAEYAGGLNAVGVQALQTFVQAGGTLICLAQSAGLAIAAFELPIRDITQDADDRLFVPGSILRLDVDTSRPLAYGMEARTAAFFSFSSAFASAPAGAVPAGQINNPSPAAGMETVARYANKDLLLSGWLEGEELLAGRAAVVQAAVGKGHVVLFGFPVQHRGQSDATFRLLFNAIFAAR